MDKSRMRGRHGQLNYRTSHPRHSNGLSPSTTISLIPSFQSKHNPNKQTQTNKLKQTGNLPSHRYYYQKTVPAHPKNQYSQKHSPPTRVWQNTRTQAPSRLSLRRTHGTKTPPPSRHAGSVSWTTSRRRDGMASAASGPPCRKAALPSQRCRSGRRPR